MRRIEIAALALVISTLPAYRIALAEQEPSPVQTLEIGNAIEREIATGQSHPYRVSVPAGHFLRASVEQRGVDVLVVLTNPTGETISEIDSPTGNQGVESVSLVTVEAGTYGVSVQVPEGADPPAGRYSVRIDELRPVESRDAHRVAGDRAAALGIAAWNEQTEESLGRALTKYEEARTSFNAAGVRASEADALSSIAALHQALGNPAKALDVLTVEIEIRSRLGDKGAEARALGNVGQIRFDLGETDRALDLYTRALPLARSAGDRAQEGILLVHIGQITAMKGDRKKGFQTISDAIPALREAGARDFEARAYTLLGTISYDLGVPRKAIEEHQRAVPLWEALGDVSGLAGTLNGIGAAHFALGENQAAIDTYTRALRMAESIGDKAVGAQIVGNLGTVYGAVGDRESARTYLDRALEAARGLGDRPAQGRLLNQKGWLYLHTPGASRTADARTAIVSLSASLPIRRAIHDRLGEAQTLTNLGDAYDRTGRRAQARVLLENARSIVRGVGNRREEAHVLWILGRTYAASGQYRKALDLYGEALPLSRVAGDRSSEAMALYRVARVERALGKLDDARRDVEAALDIVEGQRATISSPELRAFFLGEVYSYYQFYIDLLMELHRRQPKAGFDAAALQASERARARSLVELLVESGADIRRGIDPALRERLRSVQARLDEAAEQRLRLDGNRGGEESTRDLDRVIENLTRDYATLVAEVRAASPHFAALVYPLPLRVADIQREVLDPETILLEYALGEERSYLWVVGKDWIHSHELPGRAQIEAASRGVLAAMTAPASGIAGQRELSIEADVSAEEARDLRVARAQGAYVKAARLLSDLVLRPAASDLVGKRLLVVPDGILHYVPFTALPTPAAAGAKPEPLLAVAEVVSAPSATAVAVLRRETANRAPAKNSLAVLADPVFEPADERLRRAEAERKEGGTPTPDAPDGQALQFAVRASKRADGAVRIPRLKGTRQEADAILPLAPSERRRGAFDFDANYATATSEEFCNHRILHFATHGILDSSRPELSGLVLSLYDASGARQRGFLRTHEIFNLDIPADLVVLSACQTGLGKEVRGEGLVGLSRAFMYAGAPRVVVSLWDVDDEATAELMSAFYVRMLRGGMVPAAALRASQLDLMKHDRWRQPFYWAAFVVQGDWR